MPHVKHHIDPEPPAPTDFSLLPGLSGKTTKTDRGGRNLVFKYLFGHGYIQFAYLEIALNKEAKIVFSTFCYL